MAKQLRKLVLLLGLLVSLPSWGAFTFNAANGANSASSSNLTTGTFNATTGDTVVCSIAMFTQTINNVTDVNSVALTKTVVVSTPGGGKEYLAYEFNVTGNASFTVSVTTTGGPNELSIACGSWTPPASTTVAFDVSNSGSGSTTAATVSVLSVTAGDLVIGGASWDNTATPSAGSGYTIPTNGAQPSNGDASTHQPTAIEYNVNATGGTTTVNMTTGTGFAIWGAAFKATASGGATPSAPPKTRRLEIYDNMGMNVGSQSGLAAFGIAW